MKLITIVTDIGGPVALHGLLSELPSDFKTPILVMQSTTEIIQDSTIATLRKTISLPIAPLKRKAALQAGSVYFGEPDKSYFPMPGEAKLAIDYLQNGAGATPLSDSLTNLARVLGEDLTLVFLSGRGNAAEISKLCSVLESCHVPILVLSRLESVVDELGRCALTSAPSAVELSAQQIVDFLLQSSIHAKTGSKVRQRVGKR